MRLMATKRVFHLLFGVFLALALAACSSGNGAKNELADTKTMLGTATEEVMRLTDELGTATGEVTRLTGELGTANDEVTASRAK